MTENSPDAFAVARLCARILDDQKMADIKIFDVRASFQITDCFVIATGRNRRHLSAAADRLLRELRQAKIKRRGKEGYPEGKWILLDLGDVVVHLFLEESRRYYDLELLWGDSPRVAWEREDPAASLFVAAGRVATEPK